MSLKRFVLHVYEDGVLDDVVVGLKEVNSYVTKALVNPPVEDLKDELSDPYEFESELEEDNE